MAQQVEGVVTLPLVTRGASFSVLMATKALGEDDGKRESVRNFSANGLVVVGGKYCPGGMVDRGEQLHAAAEREWKQEVGSLPNNFPGRLIPVDGYVMVDYVKTDQTYEVAVTCFAIQLAEEEVDSLMSAGMVVVDINSGSVFDHISDDMREREAAILTFFAQGQLALAEEVGVI